MVNRIESRVPNIGRIEGSVRSDPSRWRSALLVSAIRDNQLASAQMRATCGTDFNHVFALHMAAHRKDPSYVRCLLENGADPTLTDQQGRTALHIAILNGFVETATALIEGGSDVNHHMPDQANFAKDWEEPNLIGAPPLVLACGNLQMAGLLLARGADLNLRDDCGETAFHHACSRGDLPLIKLLLDLGSPADIVGPCGQTPLHYLTKCDDTDQNVDDLTEAVVFLIGMGKALAPPRDFLDEITQYPSPTKGSDELNGNHTPISLAVTKGRWKLLQVLSELGGSFPATLDLAPSIRKAAQEFEVDALALLCGKGRCPPPDSVLVLVESFVDKRKYSREDMTILCDKFKESVTILCSAGADINLDGSVRTPNSFSAKMQTTPLTLAVTVPGSREVSQYLLSRGANLYYDSRETFDPILTATLFGEQQDISCLLDHSMICPNPSHWTRFLRDVPDGKDAIERVCFCLRKAALLEKTNSGGETLLRLAVQEGNAALVTGLIAVGARVDTPDKGGNCETESESIDAMPDSATYQAALNDVRALAIAVKKDDGRIVSKLLQAGSDPNQTITEHRNTIPVLYYAARHGQHEIVCLLLHHNADMEATDNHGWRPLHVACFKGHIDIVKTLISKGADVHASTMRWINDREKPSGLYEGNAWTGTSLHTATMGGHSDIVKILLEHNVDVNASTGVTDNHLAYPASGPKALHIALSVNTFYGITPHLPTPGRLQIAQWLVEAGAMVQGVIQRLSLKEILRFEHFPEL